MVAILSNELMNSSSQSGRSWGGYPGGWTNIYRDVKMGRDTNSTVRLGVWQGISLEKANGD